MKNDRLPNSHRIALAAALALGLSGPAKTHAQLPSAQPPGRDQVAFQQAQQLYEAAKYPDAIKGFESIQKDFPTSAYIPAANLQLGLSYFFVGDYDINSTTFGRISDTNTNPRIAQFSLKLGF